VFYINPRFKFSWKQMLINEVTSATLSLYTMSVCCFVFRHFFVFSWSHIWVILQKVAIFVPERFFCSHNSKL
jgi:hypothetical protein